MIYLRPSNTFMPPVVAQFSASQLSELQQCLRAHNLASLCLLAARLASVSMRTKRALVSHSTTLCARSYSLPPPPFVTSSCLLGGWLINFCALIVGIIS